MNREIKFRGKCTHSGEWVYGYYLMDGETHRIFEINRKSLTSTGFYTGTLVITETVGQYTGLKDVVGKEIYEGDAVHSDDHQPPRYAIEFIEGGFCATNKLIKGYPIDINHFYPSIGCAIKVIGNIHDNPELIK